MSINNNGIVEEEKCSINGEPNEAASQDRRQVEPAIVEEVAEQADSPENSRSSSDVDM